MPGFTPWQWQTLALTEVMPLLRRGEFATVSAAPGAGKTKFSLWVLRQLFDADIVGRVVIFVPTAHLRTQWADDGKAMGVFLGTEGVSHKPSQDGVVVTYHALNNAEQLDQLARDAEAVPTLFILDEVHHLAHNIADGGAGVWAVGINRLVGTVEHPRHPVLNLSGTLFRSNLSPMPLRCVKRYSGKGDTTLHDAPPVRCGQSAVSAGGPPGGITW